MSDSFDTAMKAAELRPFAMLVILTVFGIPITMAVQRWMPESKLKRLLLDWSMIDRKPWGASVAFFLLRFHALWRPLFEFIGSSAPPGRPDASN